MVQRCKSQRGTVCWFADVDLYIQIGYQSVISGYDEGEVPIFLNSSRVVNSKHVLVHPPRGVL